jgi:hypothetical protein
MRIGYTPKLGKSKPQGEEELEGVVEREPVDSVNSTFKNPISHIRLACDKEDSIIYVKKANTTQY